MPNSIGDAAVSVAAFDVDSRRMVALHTDRHGYIRPPASAVGGPIGEGTSPATAIPEGPHR